MEVLTVTTAVNVLMIFGFLWVAEGQDTTKEEESVEVVLTCLSGFREFPSGVEYCTAIDSVCQISITRACQIDSSESENSCEILRYHRSCGLSKECGDLTVGPCREALIDKGKDTEAFELKCCCREDECNRQVLTHGEPPALGGFLVWNFEEGPSWGPVELEECDILVVDALMDNRNVDLQPCDGLVRFKNERAFDECDFMESEDVEAYAVAPFFSAGTTRWEYKVNRNDAKDDIIHFGCPEREKCERGMKFVVIILPTEEGRLGEDNDKCDFEYPRETSEEEEEGDGGGKNGVNRLSSSVLGFLIPWMLLFR